MDENLKKNLKELGKRVAITQAKYQKEFEAHITYTLKDCRYRHTADLGRIGKVVVVCTHPDNKHAGTNYSGCIYDSCPYVML